MTLEGEGFECRCLIICCGGKSFQGSGSDGSGFSLAQQLGHSIVPPIPSLVQLKLKYAHLKAVSGVKFDGQVKIVCGEKESRPEYGEVLFTVNIEIDMMPEMSRDELEEFLENHFGTFNYRSVLNSLIGVINKKLIPIVLKESGIRDFHKPCGELTILEKKKLYSIIKSWSFSVYDTNSFKNAQVTAGGVDTSEVSTDTLESKIVPNLYFAGEVLDVDGDCGGFNLQWAWSSGYIAAMGSSKK
jgi:predicted flavoprotein YhiN